MEAKKNPSDFKLTRFYFLPCRSPLSSNGKVNEVEGEIMHMDVKEPAKLGVRFNWCKCVAGRLGAPAAPAVLWARHGRGAAPAWSRHPCHVTKGGK